MKSWIVVVIVSAVVGFAAGNFTQSEPEQGSSTLSSYNGKSDTAIMYPCPSAEEFNNLAKIAKLKGNFQHTCSNLKMSKLGRVLKFISQANTKLPAKWVGARDALENPLKYVHQKNRSMQADFNQRTTLAFNSYRGDIYLGGRFFTNDVLDSALSVLHETRHSDPLDPAHTTCRWGDIAGATGGCDIKFSVDNHAGAYSYQVLIGIAWAKYLPGLTQGQREYLISVALMRLAARFTIVPHTLAVPVEQIWALDEDGRVFPVSQITGQLGPALIAPMPYKRIEFYNATNGFIAYNGTSAFLHKASGASHTGFFNFRKVAAQPIRDVNSMSNRRGSEQDPFEYLITAENVLKFFDTDVTTGERYFNESEYQPRKFGFNVMRLTHARRKRYGLTDQRKVIFLDDDSSKVSESTFSDPKGFRQLDGGLFYSALYGVNSNGQIKFWDESKKETRDSLHQFSGPVRKLAYSVSFTAALLDKNKLELRLMNSKQKLLEINHPRRLVDIVVTRGYQLNHSMFGATELPTTLKQASAACGLQKAYPGVWSADIVGLNANGQVITWSPQSRQCVLANFSRYGIKNSGFSSIELVGAAFGGTTNLSFPTVVLKKANGSTSSFVPYNFR